MILSNAAIGNRTTVGVLVVLIIVSGTWAYVTLPRESAPDVPIPWVLVTTLYEGVSPEDIETTVTMKIEQELAGLKGVKEVYSTSREGVSLIRVEFLPEMVIEDALQYVRDRVDLAKPELPEQAEEPMISEINFAEFPVMMVSISGSISPVRLKAIAERVEDEIEQVPGVLGSDVLGGLEREIRLEFDPDRLAAYEISISEMATLISGENVNISAGGLDTPGTKFSVRVTGEFDQAAEIDHLLLTERAGKPIYLTDVATVRDTFEGRDTYSRLDGKSSITLTVKKRVGANILELASHVRGILDEARKKLPEGVTLEVTMDQSDDVNMLVADLENNILTALVLVVLVMMLAMGLRTSLIVALAIPLSMLMSFAILQAMDVTLNMVVLFSLVLALGMLVDNAIVIVENIYRFMQEGHGRLEAARLGAAEVAWPVITSTATTIAAFAPMLVWTGVMGEFMSYLPLTVIVVLSSSLFVALVITPVAASVLARVPVGTPPQTWIGRFWGRAIAMVRTVTSVVGSIVQRGYRGVLQTALGSFSHRIATLTLTVTALIAVGVLFGKYNFGVELFPKPDPKNALVNIRLPQGANVAYTDLLTRQAEGPIEQVRDDLKHVNSNVGSADGAQGFGAESIGPHVSNITLVFRDYQDRARPSAVAVDEVRVLLSGIPGAEVKVAAADEGPPTGAPVAVRIAGESFQELADIASRVKAHIADVPGLVNLRSDYEAARPELRFIPDRERAKLLHVNTFVIGQFLKTGVFGLEAGKYRQFNDEYDITIRLPLLQRQNIDDLFRLQVPDTAGNPIPLSSLGEFHYSGGYGDINRIDQKRVVTITADVPKGVQSEEVLKRVQARLADMKLKPGYTITYAGEKEEQDKAVAFLAKAYAIAILAILMILVAQFNTLGVPGIIMLTVVLSLIGVGAGLLITATPFGVIMTGIGVVSLAGVVVNNAIVLLDYTRQLERRGFGLVEAAVQAGMTRLRPVLLTAVTTILSLIPMAVGKSIDFRTFSYVAKSESSQWWASMAIAVIFGLGFATVLTLVVVPTMYVFIYAGLERLGFGGLRKAGNGQGMA